MILVRPVQELDIKRAFLHLDSRHSTIHTLGDLVGASTHLASQRFTMSLRDSNNHGLEALRTKRCNAAT